MTVVQPAITTAIERVAQQLLTDAGLSSAPIDIYQLARRLDTVTYQNPDLPNRAMLSVVGRQSCIIVRPDPRQERMQFAAAHELGEQFAPDIAEELGLAGDDPRLMEELANQLAGALLVPLDCLREAVRQQGAALPRLKAQVFRNVSHEVIARRLLVLGDPMILTIFDHGRQTLRISNLERTPGRLAPLEVAACQACRATRETVERRDSELAVVVWPIDDPVTGWQREIMRTVPGEGES